MQGGQKVVRLLVCGFIVDAPGKQTESQATHIFMHTDMFMAYAILSNKSEFTSTVIQMTFPWK